MKKNLLFLIVTLILGSQSVFGQEIDHEKVLTDGYQKVTKGAYWVKRPEAKQVYEGKTPDGVEVIILSSDHFVRFAKGEHNPLDINYIVFPAGEKIYKKDGQYFAAICGNKIETWRPVEKIVEKIKTVVQQASSDSVTTKKRPLDYGGVVKTEKKPPVVNPTIVDLGKKHKKDRSEKTWVGRNLGWLIPAAIVVIAGSILGAKELKKKPVAHQAHMSGGIGDEYTQTTAPTTGGNTGSGGGFNN